MIEALGHVVIKVRHWEAAERFYAEVWGLPAQSRSEESQMTASRHRPSDFVAGNDMLRPRSVSSEALRVT